MAARWRRSLICSHFFGSQAKLEPGGPDRCARIAARPSITKAQQGRATSLVLRRADQHIHAGVAAMSTHIAPEAMQSSTNRPPTVHRQSATAFR